MFENVTGDVYLLVSTGTLVIIPLQYTWNGSSPPNWSGSIVYWPGLTTFSPFIALRFELMYMSAHVGKVSEIHVNQ